MTSCTKKRYACRHHFFAAPTEGQVCRVWRELAQDALKQGAEYTVLLGDDVRLLSPGWMTAIQYDFEAMHAEVFDRRGVREDVPPVGFGVVSFTDKRSPGFPGFPVLHRTHYEIFPDIFPGIFINQDADPWIFEVMFPLRCLWLLLLLLVSSRRAPRLLGAQRIKRGAKRGQTDERIVSVTLSDKLLGTHKHEQPCYPHDGDT